jgi:hypothetical protein
VLRDHSSDRFTLGSFTVYPGFTEIRQPEASGLAWSATDHHALVGLQLSSADSLEPQHVHGISVVVHVDARSAVDGECRIDGMSSFRALRAVERFPWPPNKAGYTSKQYYILVPTG